jgi:hypothetical protein
MIQNNLDPEVAERPEDLVVYGGTAINAILPKEDQFYNRDIEIPDYDFFSPNALDDAKELCDIYVKEGFREVEGKPGVHEGTFKVYVNFIAVADITYLHNEIFKAIKRESIKRDDILYAPPNYLRMSMFLELSRPAGDVSRWEKVLKRLTLLNKHYPLTAKHCNNIEFQRDMEDKKNEDTIFDVVKNTLVDEEVVFFGGYAMSLYSHYMPPHLKKKFKKYPDFDVLTEEPEKVAKEVSERLKEKGVKNVKISMKPAIGEIIAPHYEIKVGKDIVAFIYEPLSCHSYNVINVGGRKLKIATIDTMLSFYLAFLYASRDYYDTDRILCIAQYLFKVQQENRLKQSGLLRRFSINCYGHQDSLSELKKKKAEKFMDLKKKKSSKEYEENFLRYRPVDNVRNKEPEKEKEKETEEPIVEKKQKTRKMKSQKKKIIPLYERFNQKHKKTRKIF